MSWVLLSKTTIDISWTRGRRKAEFKILELIQIKSCFRKDSVANSTNQTLASWQSRISSAANCLKITRSANHESAFTADKTRDCKITKRWRWPIFSLNVAVICSYSWDGSISLLLVGKEQKCSTEWYIYLYYKLYNQECVGSSLYGVSSLVKPGRIGWRSGLEEES